MERRGLEPPVLVVPDEPGDFGFGTGTRRQRDYLQSIEEERFRRARNCRPPTRRANPPITKLQSLNEELETSEEEAGIHQ